MLATWNLIASVLVPMEHWLPLLEEKLGTLFDHIGDDAVVVRDFGSSAAADQRFEAIDDYYANRQKAMSAQPGSYRPTEPGALYLSADQWREAIEAQPIHLATPFAAPDSDKSLDFGVEGARDFGAERAQNANVYEAVVKHGFRRPGCHLGPWFRVRPP